MAPSTVSGLAAQKRCVTMNARFARNSILVCVLSGVACQGCTSFKPLPSAEAPAVIAAIDAGDRIRVRDSTGHRFRLQVTGLDHDYIVGSVDGTETRIELADVLVIERRVPAPGKTVALIAGSAFSLVTALFIYVAVDAGGSFSIGFAP
jgi:hypothetical protein